MGTNVPRGKPVRSASSRWIWMSIGWVSVALGSIGAVVPGLPTTVFFVVAASCFARSSPRFERWVLSLPKIGPLVRDHQAGLGMPRQAKITAISMMVAAVAVSAGFLLSSPVWRIVVVALGAVGVWYVGWRIPTRGAGNSPAHHQDRPNHRAGHPAPSVIERCAASSRGRVESGDEKVP